MVLGEIELGVIGMVGERVRAEAQRKRMNVASRCSCSYLLCRSIQGEVDLTDIITPSTPDACEPGDDPGDTYARLEGLISATPPAARFWRRGDPMPPPDPVSLPLPIRNGRTFQAAAGSWHCVDVVWIFLVPVLYLL